MATSDWIAVEWSRGHLRAWVMGPDGKPRHELAADAPDGEGFETTLGRLVADYLEDDAATDILVAGDPAGPTGWQATPVSTVPCAPLPAGDLLRIATRDDRLRLSVVPGVAQQAPKGLLLADTLRVGGFLAQNDGFDGVICLAGHESHWVHVSAGEIVSFRSFLTGDLVEAMQAFLSVEGAPGDGFEGAVSDGMAKPELVPGRLASILAGARLGQTDEADIDALWGLFLGQEIAATRAYWLGQRVVVIGSGARADLYAQALEAQAAMVERADEKDALLAGFRALRS